MKQVQPANKGPVRCFDGNAKPYEPFWTLRDAAAAESGEPEIEFYGIISEYSWWGDEITPAKFKADLMTLGRGGPVTIRISSPGGELFAASKIRSMLVDYPGRVTTRIDGLCASAATFIATAGDRIYMQDTAFFMIHDPWMVIAGDVEDFNNAIDFLKTIKSGLVDAYEGKTKLGIDKIAKMMSDETWMSAKEAVEYGFVDEVIGGPQKAKAMILQNAALLNCLNGYSNIPEQVKGMFIVENLPDMPEASEPVVDDEIQREAQILRDRVNQILRKESQNA
jgi:ATP-dependent Clp protease protease subunit